MISETEPFKKLTPKMAFELAAPHTWPAAVMPVLIATCAAASLGPISATLCITLLLIAILMQSSVNTFNDYYDYIKGADSAEDNVEESDAVLVYNNVDPQSALKLAIAFLIAAFVLGIYPIAVAGLAPLAIALIGAVIVVLYSAGKSPISYLPIGEVVSGFVMGCLIALGAYVSLTRTLDFLMLVIAIPVAIGIALIMFTNNTSDIERDIPTGRKTLPVLLGRERSVMVYKALLIIWVVAILVIDAIWYRNGLLLAPFMLACVYPLLKVMFANPFTPERRIQSMSQILSVNLVLGAFYAASILASTLTLSL